MTNFNVNINPNDVINQMETENQKKVFTTFDPKNYLNTRLGDNESSKTLTIRLLPPSADGGFPFTKVHMHTIKVNKEVSASGWKTFVCPTHNGMGDACPFCMVSEESRKLEKICTDVREREKYKEIANLNRAKEMWVVRCIERGHEEDGVKFWLVPNSKDGAYAKIMSVWNARWKKGQEKGQINNIFDLNNGKDLEVTISKSSDGKNVISVVDDSDRSPLTDNFELGSAWINDTKKWFDVYKVKPFDYMEVIVNGGVPVFSKEKNKYVNRDAENEEKSEKEEKETKDNLTQQTIDYTQIPTQEQINKDEIFVNEPAVVAVEDDDDLPF